MVKSNLLIVGWPQTVHVPPVLHAEASCAPAQLVLKEPKKFVYDIRLLFLLPGATLIIVGVEYTNIINYFIKGAK